MEPLFRYIHQLELKICLFMYNYINISFEIVTCTTDSFGSYCTWSEFWLMLLDLWVLGLWPFRHLLAKLST